MFAQPEWGLPNSTPWGRYKADPVLMDQVCLYTSFLSLGHCHFLEVTQEHAPRCFLGHIVPCQGSSKRHSLAKQESKTSLATYSSLLSSLFFKYYPPAFGLIIHVLSLHGPGVLRFLLLPGRF